MNADPTQVAASKGLGRCLAMLLVVTSGCDSGRVGGGGGDAGDAADAAGTADATDTADAARADGPQPASEEALACVAIHACLRIAFTNHCWTYWLPWISADMIQCAAAAGSDCEAVGACIGYAFTSNETCTPAMSSCEDGNVVGCSDFGTRTTFCGAPLSGGPTCIEGTEGAGCGTGTCTSSSLTCEGTRALVCNEFSGIQHETDCSVLGQICVEGACTDAGGGAACGATGFRCEGTQLVDCYEGIEYWADCGEVVPGATCRTSGSGAYCGTAEVCAQNAGEELCVDGVLEFCAGGVPAAVDCIALGYASCQESRCRP